MSISPLNTLEERGRRWLRSVPLSYTRGVLLPGEAHEIQDLTAAQLIAALVSWPLPKR